MSMSLRSIIYQLQRAACFLAFAMTVSVADAQDYPTREIRMINGYAAGAGADVTSRVFGKHLEEMLGKPVIIDNRPGAFTNLAAAAVARAQPDGYTLMFSGHTAITSNAHLFKTLPFDPVKDFTAIAPAGKQEFAFAVPTQSPVRTVAELTAFLKMRGAKGFMIAEFYKSLTGAPAIAVPYKSSGDALSGIIRGDIDLLVYDAGTLTQQERDGRLRMLAVTSADRSTLRPDLPGMRDAGLPEIDLGSWFGLWGPANVPPAVVNRLSAAVRQIWEKEDKRRALSAMATEPFLASPAEFAQFITSEQAKWRRVIEVAKIEPQ